MELVYDDLRGLAHKYLGSDTAKNSLPPTAVVHEAFLKLIDADGVDWRGKSHFYAVSATAMRSILVDHARRKAATKRGGGRQRISLEGDISMSTQNDEDVLAIDEALSKLEAIDVRRARIVELRFFGGMTNREVAEVLGVSSRTVETEWAGTRLWLRRELAGGTPGEIASD